MSYEKAEAWMTGTITTTQDEVWALSDNLGKSIVIV